MFDRKKFDFTVSWFRHNIKNWEGILHPLKTKKINVLEIGAFEGESTTWILEELLHHPESKIYTIDTFQGGIAYRTSGKIKDPHTFPLELEQRFYNNIDKTGKIKQVTVMKSDSYSALIRLNTDKLTRFDFIYLDGSHMASDVISDAVLAWSLLSENGIMIFDDYEWDFYKEKFNNPKIAINAFLACFAPEIEIIHKGYQVAIKKIKKQKPYTKKLFRIRAALKYLACQF